MKTVRLIIFFCFLATTFSACGHDIIVKKSDLPQQAQQFIDTYFGNETISYITKDGKSFEVKFTNGFELEFDRNGLWTEVDCEHTIVPQGIVPQAISDYINTTFSGSFIVKISREFHHFDVELNNGLDLVFDKNGNFKYIDD